MKRITAEGILTTLEVVRYPAKRFVVSHEVRAYPFTPPFATKFERIKRGARSGDIAGLCEVVDSKKRVVCAALSQLEAYFVTSALNHYTEVP
jgi:hypothetical protein